MPRFDREPLKHSGIFLDGPTIQEFNAIFRTGMVGGVTTNPSLIKKAEVNNAAEYVAALIKKSGPGFPISFQIPESSWSQEDMIAFGRRYHKRFPKNAVVKVPMDPYEPWKSFQVMRMLAKDGIRVNATIGLSMGQLIGASEALRDSKAEGDNYVSLFWSRRNDAVIERLGHEVSLHQNSLKKKDPPEQEPVEVTEARLKPEISDAAKTLTLTREYLSTHGLRSKIIVGSIRGAYQIEQAFGLGADIVTIPPALLKDWLDTPAARRTATQFNNDYEAVRKSVKLF